MVDSNPHIGQDDYTIVIPFEKEPTLSEEDSLAGPNNLPEPYHHSYRCNWIRCKVHLHNLETLRRHVLKLHIPAADDPTEGGFVCWWKRCRYLTINDDQTVDPVHEFSTEQDLRQHIEEDHLEPVGLAHGDGPSTRTDHLHASRTKREFLTDVNGLETTPSLPEVFSKTCEYPPHDVLELTRHDPEGLRSIAGKSDEKARKAFLKTHGIKPKDQRRSAEETLRAMTVRKQKIGPGIERGGCTLINEARRATFVQAPGIYRIIEAEF